MVRMGPVDMSQLLINRDHLLEAIELDPANLRHFTAILAPSADSQNVVIVEEALNNIHLRAALRKLGHWRPAVALEVLGDGHMAYDAPGLTLAQRTARLDKEAHMLKVVLGGRMGRVSGLTSDKPVGGLTRDQTLALLSNIENRSALLKCFPDLRKTMNDRF